MGKEVSLDGWLGRADRRTAPQTPGDVLTFEGGVNPASVVRPPADHACASIDAIRAWSAGAGPQEQVRARQAAADAQNAAPLCAGELARVPAHVLADMSALVPSTPARPGCNPDARKHALKKTAQALWAALEANTAKASSKWKFVRNPAVPELYRMSEAQADRHKAALPRFADIGNPVRGTAVQDRVRRVEGNVTPFLHANHIDLYCGMQFIGSQLPMAGEVPGFHRMLLDHNVGLVVDLTRPQERDDSACYAPAKGQTIIAPGSKLQVSCKAVSSLPAEQIHLETLLIAENGSNVREVIRLHFEGWPDHGVISPTSLMRLAGRATSCNTDPKRPIVVHCRAGVGRTGTLISYLAARKRIQKQLQSNGNICTPELVVNTLMQVVAKGRMDRGPMFVQTEEQFSLALETLLQTFAEQMAPTPRRSSTPWVSPLHGSRPQPR